MTLLLRGPTANSIWRNNTPWADVAYTKVIKIVYLQHTQLNRSPLADAARIKRQDRSGRALGMRNRSVESDANCHGSTDRQ